AGQDHDLPRSARASLRRGSRESAPPDPARRAPRGRTPLRNQRRAARGDRALLMHFGVILPNYGPDSNPDGIRRVAERAEELGFDSVWATEHIIVGPEAIDPYGRAYAPLVTLGWIAGLPARMGLRPSIVAVP